MTPDDLSWVSDDDLYALEQQRGLEPSAWAEVDAELRRRRHGRRAALADGARPAVAAPTLGDVERIGGSLEAALDARFTAMEARLRRLRWWVLLTPPLWALAGAATVLALSRWAPAALRTVAALP